MTLVAESGHGGLAEWLPPGHRVGDVNWDSVTQLRRDDLRPGCRVSDQIILLTFYWQLETIPLSQTHLRYICIWLIHNSYVYPFHLFENVKKVEWIPINKYSYEKKSIYNFCRLCFVKLKLLLLSIEAKQGEGGDTKISINPRHNKIAANMVGFFMAQSAEEVKRSVQIYVNNCEVLLSSVVLSLALRMRF